ncbi:MAG: MlaD family protein [Bdellovibrionales bacterium]|nr:MlaD family protein [Bdellovibrionales bacterium]
MKKFFTKQLIVAIFMIVGLGVLIKVTLIMGKNRMTIFHSVSIYRSIFKDTRGVYIGSEVTVHGVRTGNVIKTKVLPDGTVEISFTTLKKHAFAINQSSIVQLKTLGMLGDRYVNIFTPDLEAQPLKKGSLIPSKIAPNLMNLLSGGNKKNNIQDLIQSTQTLLESANSLMEDLSQTMEKTNNILTKIEKGEGTLGALIHNRSLYNRVLTLLGEKPRHNYIKELYKKSSKKEAPSSKNPKKK